MRRMDAPGKANSAQTADSPRAGVGFESRAQTRGREGVKKR